MEVEAEPMIPPPGNEDHLESDPRDYVLDLSPQAIPKEIPPNKIPLAQTAATTPTQQPPTEPPSRAYLSIHFKCCNAFARIFPNAQGTSYAGHCPKCARPVQIKIGPGGTTNRTFTVE